MAMIVAAAYLFRLGQDDLGLELGDCGTRWLAQRFARKFLLLVATTVNHARAGCVSISKSAQLIAPPPREHASDGATLSMPIATSIRPVIATNIRPPWGPAHIVWARGSAAGVKEG